MCSLILVRADDVTFFLSLICEELDRPRTGEEEEKVEDIKEKENEKDAAERRKIRGAWKYTKNAQDFFFCWKLSVGSHKVIQQIFQNEANVLKQPPAEP